MQPISLILTDSKIIFSIQPHLNFEHYKETHNKRFSSRHYCPMESCNSSYSRKNVLTAHLRKAHEVPEDDIIEHTSHDEPLTIDCLLCGADLTSLSTGKLSFYKTLYFSVHLRNLIIVFSWKKWALWKTSPVRSPLLPICWTIYKRAAWCPAASTSSQFNRLKSKLRDWANRSRAEAILLRIRVRLLWLLPLLLRINSLFCIVHLLIGLFSLSLGRLYEGWIIELTQLGLLTPYTCAWNQENRIFEPLNLTWERPCRSGGSSRSVRDWTSVMYLLILKQLFSNKISTTTRDEAQQTIKVDYQTQRDTGWF